MRLAVLLLLACTTTCLLCEASRELPSKASSIESGAYDLAALHTISVPAAATGHVPATRTISTQLQDTRIIWPSPWTASGTASKLQALRYRPGGEDDEDDEELGAERRQSNGDKASYGHDDGAGYGHEEGGHEDVPVGPYLPKEACLLSTQLNLSTAYDPDTSTVSSSLVQGFTKCCPEDSMYGPRGPFAPQANYGASADHDPKPKVQAPWPKLDSLAEGKLLAYCNWTLEDGKHESELPVPDFTTSIIPVGLVSGTCYLALAADQCGLEVPFVPPRDVMATSAWTVRVEQAMMYAAMAKAYVPPLFNLMGVGMGGNGSTNDNYTSYGYTDKSLCGISLAVVGQGSVYDPQEQYAGVAGITDELVWCSSPSFIDIIPSVGLRGDKASKQQYIGQGCLPFFRLSEAAPAPAPAPIPAPAPAERAPTQPAPTQPPAPGPAAAWAPPASVFAPALSAAWKASYVKLQAAAIASTASIGNSASGFTNRMADILRATAVPGQQEIQQICSQSPAVGFASPGTVKVTLDLGQDKKPKLKTKPKI